MKPDGLKPFPEKPIEHVVERVEVDKPAPINDSVNWWDSVRLWLGKTIENKAFNQFQISRGQAVAATGGAGGIGFLLSINWVALAAGSPVEIVKLVVALIGFALTVFWKK